MSRLFTVAPDVLAARLCRELRSEGFLCYSGKNEMEIVRARADLALVAIEGAEDEAVELCRRLTATRHVSVLGLVSKTAMAGLRGAALPCTDFIVEPYELNELLTRIRKIMLRHQGSVPPPAVGLTVSPTQAEVYLDGKPLELTFREYELLRFMATHPGRVFSRDELLNAVWGYDYFGGDRTVDVHIRRLRSKIELGGHSFIDTVRNMGYRFKKT